MKRLFLFLAVLVLGCHAEPQDRPVFRDASPGCASPTTGGMTGTIEMPPGSSVAIRNFRVDTPAWWDGTTPIPVAYTFHACGSDHNNGSYNSLYYRSQQQWLAPGLDAYDMVVVMGDSEETCWEIDPGEEDLTYIELLRDVVESTYCVDTDRRFHAGISSGGFIAQASACRLGGVAATFAGASGMHYPPGVGYNLTPSPMPDVEDCQGPVATMLMHGSADTLVPIQTYGIPARDRWLEINGCDPQSAEPYTHLVPAANAAASPNPGEACTGLPDCSCVRYECTGAPVVWCEHSGAHVWPPYHRDATTNWFAPFSWVEPDPGDSSSDDGPSSSESTPTETAAETAADSTTCEMVCQCI